MLDVTQKPLKIPPDFQAYAEKHEIYQLYEKIIERLIIERPKNPIDAMIQSIENSDTLRIMVLGPILSGKSRLAKLLSTALGIEYISPLTIANDAVEAGTVLGKQAKTYVWTKQDIPDSLLLGLMVEKLKKQKAFESRKGWVFDGFPRNRDQALACQMAGIIPTNVVFLCADDEKLLTRLDGLRVHQHTGDIYHLEYDLPEDINQEDLVMSDGHRLDIVLEKQAKFRRAYSGLNQCYQNKAAYVDATQLKEEVLEQVINTVKIRSKSHAPHPTRALFIGLPGSGKRTLSEMFHEKYGIVPVNLSEIIAEKSQGFNEVGKAIRNCREKGENVPSSIISSLLKGRLNQSDCVAKGYIVFGIETDELYKIFTSDAEGVKAAILFNRIILFDLSPELSKTRRCLRCMDPYTGEVYHMQDNPPPTPEISKRLVQHKDDSALAVNQKCQSFQKYASKMYELYGDILQTFDASGEMRLVFLNIESKIIRPLPRQFE